MRGFGGVRECVCSNSLLTCFPLPHWQHLKDKCGHLVLLSFIHCHAISEQPTVAFETYYELQGGKCPLSLANSTVHLKVIWQYIESQSRSGVQYLQRMGFWDLASSKQWLKAVLSLRRLAHSHLLKGYLIVYRNIFSYASYGDNGVATQGNRKGAGQQLHTEVATMRWRGVQALVRFWRSKGSGLCPAERF